MIPWILLVVSGLSLTFLLMRRMRMTQKDLMFQENLREHAELIEEEIKEEASEVPKPAELLGTVRKTFLKADTYMGRGEFAEAEPLFLAILTAEPEHLDALSKLGMMYMKMARFGDAELYFSKLVNLKQDPVYFSNLGAALYQQQRLIEAAEAYENALALDDRRGERLQSLAQVYHELGDQEKALHYFERAAKRKPKDLSLKLILADLYETAGRTKDATQTLKAVLNADPYNNELKARLKNL